MIIKITEHNDQHDQQHLKTDSTFYCFNFWHNWLTLTALLKLWAMGHKTFSRRFINAHLISSNSHPKEIWRDCDSRVETICVGKKMKMIEIMLQVSITVIFSVRIRYQYQSKIHAFYSLTLFTIPSPTIHS